VKLLLLKCTDKKCIVTTILINIYLYEKKYLPCLGTKKQI